MLIGEGAGQEEESQDSRGSGCRPVTSGRAKKRRDRGVIVNTVLRGSVVLDTAGSRPGDRCRTR